MGVMFAALPNDDNRVFEQKHGSAFSISDEWLRFFLAFISLIILSGAVDAIMRFPADKLRNDVWYMKNIKRTEHSFPEMTLEEAASLFLHCLE